MKLGLILGISAGVIAAVSVVITIALLCCWYRRKRDDQERTDAVELDRASNSTTFDPVRDDDYESDDLY